MLVFRVCKQISVANKIWNISCSYSQSRIQSKTCVYAKIIVNIYLGLFFQNISLRNIVLPPSCMLAVVLFGTDLLYPSLDIYNFLVQIYFTSHCSNKNGSA